jgi:hypothetical protein
MRLPILIFVAGAPCIGGCGGRTGLYVPLPNGARGEPSSYSEDGGPLDSGELTPRDALPPIDVSPPALAAPSGCPDAAATLVYVVSESNLLMSLYPPTTTFTTIGHLSCPAASGSQPFSMAVDRTGIAYVLYEDGELFRVSTATASCRATRFASGQHGFAAKFGMAFVSDGTGAGETLYVAEGNSSVTTSGNAGTCAVGARLASINTSTFTLSIIGTPTPAICSPELTGTGGGDLFGFYAVAANDSAIGQIDRITAQLTNESRLSGVPQGFAWAFGFWGGDFYTFTEPVQGRGSLVTRFRPSDGSIVHVGSTTENIVGAGVSTCAPQQ